MPIVVSVVVVVLLVMVAMWLTLIIKYPFDESWVRATPDKDKPAAAAEAADKDGERQCRHITSITIVSPAAWYYPYSWYNTYYYR